MDGALPLGLAEETNFLDGGIARGPRRSGVEHSAFAGRGEQPTPVFPSRGVAHLAVISAIADEDREDVGQCLGTST